MPPLNPIASERQTLSNPRLELMESSLSPEMRVSKTTTREALWRRMMSEKFLQKFELPAPLQFQTKTFIGDDLKGLAWFIRLDLHSYGIGVNIGRGCGFNRMRYKRPIMWEFWLRDSLKHKNLSLSKNTIYLAMYLNVFTKYLCNWLLQKLSLMLLVNISL